MCSVHSDRLEDNGDCKLNLLNQDGVRELIGNYVGLPYPKDHYRNLRQAMETLRVYEDLQRQPDENQDSRKRSRDLEDTFD